MVKNEILASTSILSFVFKEMIKISGLGTGLGKCGLNADLLVLKCNTTSKNSLVLPFLTKNAENDIFSLILCLF